MVSCCQGTCSWNAAFGMEDSLLMATTRTTFPGLPLRHSRVWKARAGLASNHHRAAVDCDERRNRIEPKSCKAVPDTVEHQALIHPQWVPVHVNEMETVPHGCNRLSPWQATATLRRHR